MRSLSSFASGLFLTLGLIAACESSLAARATGGVVVRVDNNNAQEHCINGDRDQIWLHLRRFIANRDRNLFKENVGLGMIIETNVTGVSGNTRETIRFPVSFEANVASYDRGLVSIPIEQGVLSRFALSNGDTQYSEVGLSFRFTQSQADTLLGRAVSSLINVTKNFDLPGDLFGNSFQMYASVTSQLADSLFVDNRFSTPNPLASISMTFDPDGECSDLLFEKTGTKAVILASDEDPDNGVVDVGQINSYCFEAELRPAFEIWFWSRQAGVCSGRPVSAQLLRNPYFGFYVTAKAMDGGESRGVARGARDEEMLDLCRAHGLTDPEACI